MTLTFGQPSLIGQQSKASALDALPHRWPRRTRRLSGITRRLTQSETASLAWRIIAGGAKPGEAHGLLRAWTGWEQLARHLWPIYEIPDAPYRLLCVRIIAYCGETVVLPDSTMVAPGALLCEMHCNNRAVFELVNRRDNPFAGCRADLTSLASWMVQDQLGRRIEALYGCTILTAAAQRLGFIVREKPITLRRRLENFFSKVCCCCTTRKA